MNSVKKALVFSVLSQHFSQLISFFSIVIIARLLTPSEIGVYAVAASVAFLAVELRTLGISQYLIREKEIDYQKLRSAAGIKIIISWSLGSLIALSSPYIAVFYKEPALEKIFWIISLTFLIAPFSSISSAILKREMQFHKLFIVAINTTIIRAGSSILFVLFGLSYYGLALGSFIGALAEAILLLFFRPKNIPWLPSLKGIRELFKFGLYASSSGLLQQFSLSFPDLVLGRLATMADVGLFSRGLGVIVFINNIVSKAIAPVILPYLSLQNRSGSSVAASYLKVISFQSIFCWPIFAVINLCSYPMVRAFFGTQWDAAIPIAATLSIWAILQSTHNFSSQALMVMTKEKIMFIKEISIFLIRLTAIIYSTHYGMKVLAITIVFTGIIEFCINTIVITRILKITVGNILKSLLPAALVAAICWLWVFALSEMYNFQTTNPWLSLIIIGTTVTFVWLITIYYVKHEVFEILFRTLKLKKLKNTI